MTRRNKQTSNKIVRKKIGVFHLTMFGSFSHKYYDVFSEFNNREPFKKDVFTLLREDKIP